MVILENIWQTTTIYKPTKPKQSHNIWNRWNLLRPTTDPQTHPRTEVFSFTQLSVVLCVLSLKILCLVFLSSVLKKNTFNPIQNPLVTKRKDRVFVIFASCNKLTIHTVPKLIRYTIRDTLYNIILAHCWCSHLLWSQTDVS